MEHNGINWWRSRTTMFFFGCLRNIIVMLNGNSWWCSSWKCSLSFFFPSFRGCLRNILHRFFLGSPLVCCLRNMSSLIWSIPSSSWLWACTCFFPATPCCVVWFMVPLSNAVWACKLYFAQYALHYVHEIPFKAIKSLLIDLSHWSFNFIFRCFNFSFLILKKAWLI